MEKIYLNPNLKLSDIAKATGTNRTYVSTFFNKEAGCTFYDYVNRLRIGAACDLLVNSKENLSQIAEKSGFNSAHSFIRVFSKIKGVSPTEYRRAVGGGKFMNNSILNELSIVFLRFDNSFYPM